ncbi:MAG: hypothetical protein IJS03_02020 [Eubacterium sp.]|nr:hypothetical protein [Eubacterium sp.]
MKSYIKDNSRYKVTFNVRQILFAFVVCFFLFSEHGHFELSVFLDNLHVKHFLVMIIAFLYGIPLLRKKNVRGAAEVRYVLFCAGILYVITLAFQAFHLTFKLFSVGEVYYFIMPVLLITIMFNSTNKDEADFIMTCALFTSLVLYFYGAFKSGNVTAGNILKMLNLKNLFINSISPIYESSISNYFLLMFAYFRYRGKENRAILSAIGCLFGYKRFAVLFLIIFIVVLRVVPRYKSVSNKVLIPVIIFFCLLPLTVYFVITDSFSNWFFSKFGLDFNEFSMSRFQIYRAIVYANIPNYGLGTTTAYLRANIKTIAAANLHNDLFRFYYETTILGTITFTYSYFKMSQKSWFTFLTMVYIFFELFGAFYFGQGSMSFWLLAYILIFTISIDCDNHKKQLEEAANKALINEKQK